MTDALLRWMKSRDVPITRDAYIQLAWGNDPPDPWTPEHEAELPEELQNTDEQLAFDFNPDQPRAPAGTHEGGKWTSSGGGDYSDLRTMPSEIEGVPIVKKPLPGGQLAIGGSAGIAVSTSKKAREAWKDMKAYTQKAFDAGWASAAHPNYVLWHELAHVKVKRDTPDKDSMLSNLRVGNNDHFDKMASRVSKYARTNGHEFVAEVYAALRAGRKLDDDVMKYYKFLGGPEP